MLEWIYPPNRIQALLASAAGEESWEPDYTTLEAPRIELYLRKINGEDVQLPEYPVTTIEKFLAYKCGEDVELPEPMTRLEMLLAKDTPVEPAELPEPQTMIEYYVLNMQAGGGVELTVTGNAPVTLANAIAHAIVSLTQEGKVTQASTPTPSAPKDIVCNNGAIKYGALGRNLLDPSATNTVLGYYINRTDGEIKDSSSNFMFAGYMPVEAGKTYVAYGRAKNGNDLSDYNRVAWYDSTKTWIAGANYTQNQIAVVTAPNNAAYARFSCNPSGGTSVAVTQEIVDSYNWMFAEGTAEITPFVPFVGGIYVDGTPEVLSVGGKNLNGGTIEHKGYTSTGSESTSDTFAGTLWKIPCVAGQKFTISWGGLPDGLNGVFVNTWLTDGSWNARQAISASTSLTYTIGAGVGLVNFTLYKTGGITIGDNVWLQVEYGETATTYEPYREPQTASVADLYAVGNYKDTQEIIGGTVNRAVGVAVLTGDENVQTSNACYTVGISDRLQSKVAVACSHFPYSSKSSSQTDDQTIISFSSTNIGFRYDALRETKTTIIDRTTTGQSMINLSADECAAVMALNNGDTVTLTVDGTPQTVSVIVDGTGNDKYWDIMNDVVDILVTADGSGFLTIYSSVNTVKVEATTTSAINATQFKSWLKEQYDAGTPVIVIYPLAEETTETVAGQHLTTAEGTNTVSVTSEVDPVTLTVVYKGTEEGD